MRAPATTVVLDDAGRRRLRVCAAVAGISQAEIFRSGLDHQLSLIESRYPEARRLAEIAR
jgi:hypothetical protein